MHTAPYPIISLDSIISNIVFFKVGKRNRKFRRGHYRDLLRIIVYRLYRASTGFLLYVGVQASQQRLADELGISREWVCKLLKKLRETGWIKTSAPRLPNGKRAVTTYWAGRKLQQHFIAMLKSPQRSHNHVNSATQEFPSKKKEEETDKQTDRPFPKGFMEGVMKGLIKNTDMNEKIRW